MPLSQVKRLKKIKDRLLLVLRNCNCESDLELREESYFDLKVGIDTTKDEVRILSGPRGA